MPTDQPVSSVYLQAEVLAKIEAQDFPAAVELGRHLVVYTAELYGLDCVVTTRAIALLALALDEIKPEGRQEAETWAHVAFMDFLRDVMTEDGPYSDIVSDGFLIDHIQIMREAFPQVWDHRDTFQRSGIPNFRTGTLRAGN